MSHNFGLTIPCAYQTWVDGALPTCPSSVGRIVGAASLNK